MESDKVNSIVVLGQIIMYGTLVLSIYKDAVSNYYIDVDYAPDGCAMISDESKEIEEQKYMFLVQKIQELLQIKNEFEDEGCSDCYVEIKDVFDNTCMEKYAGFSVNRSIPTGSKINLICKFQISIVNRIHTSENR